MTNVCERTLSIVVSAYQQARSIDLLLRALSDQTDMSFDVIVADDGSSDGTANVVTAWSRVLDVRHVWQPDLGVRKARVLNRAVLASEGEYIVFLDGDCIPRRGFVHAVKRAALPGWFLASRRVELPEHLSSVAVRDQVALWRWSPVTRLLRLPAPLGDPGRFSSLRDRRRPWRPQLEDFHPPEGAFGFCIGVLRADFERVNGYDMRFVGRCNEDDDLALRLKRIGLRCGWAGPESILFHLWHTRVPGRPNEPLFFETRASNRFEALSGIRELRAEAADEERTLPAQLSANRVLGSSASSAPV
jgi:glycosyltransferase involved in cell wall biosynthesis